MATKKGGNKKADDQHSNFMNTIRHKDKYPFNLSVDLSDCGIRGIGESYAVGA